MIFACVCSWVVASATSATVIVDKFATIRSGSFIDVSDFKRSFPLKKLMSSRPDLFIARDGSDPVAVLMRELNLPDRISATENFMAHNYRQLDSAMLSVIKSTNDAVVAAVLIDPFGTTDRFFLQPVTDLIVDYIRVRTSPCLIDFLPHVFSDPSIYDEYFTPFDDYAVVPKEDEGFKAIVPDDMSPLTTFDRDAGWGASSHNGVISLTFTARDFTDNRLIDVRAGCAVRINDPFSFVGFTLIDRWFMLYNSISYQLLVWRSDSVKPLAIDAIKPYLALSTGSANLCVLTGGEEDLKYVYLPTDTSIPFVATRVEHTSEDVSFGNFDQSIFAVGMIIETHAIGFVANEVNARSRFFAKRLTSAIVARFGGPLNAISRLVGDRFGVISDIIDCLNAGVKYPVDDFKVMRIAKGLCARLKVCSPEELAAWMAEVALLVHPVDSDALAPVRIIP